MPLSNFPLPYVLIWVTCSVPHAVLIYHFRPQADAFTETRTIVGTYTVSGGTSYTREATRVNEDYLFCAVGYTGPGFACSPHFAGAAVTVRLASYRHAFGKGEVVTEILPHGGRPSVYTPDAIRRDWWNQSIREALTWTLVTGGLLCVFWYQSFMTRKVKHGK